MSAKGTLKAGGQADQVLTVLRHLERGTDGWIVADNAALQKATGLDVYKVASGVASLNDHGLIERRRRGNRTIAFRLIGEENGVNPLAVGEPLDYSLEPEVEPAEVAQSMREKVLRAIQDRADSRGAAKGLTTDELRRFVGLTVHDTTKVLWDLKKLGLLGFREQRKGQSTDVGRFQLRGSAMPRTVAAKDDHGGSVVLGDWSVCPECHWDRKWHRVDEGNLEVLICPSHPKAGSPSFARATSDAARIAPVINAPHPILPAGRDKEYTKPSPVRSAYRCPTCSTEFGDVVALRMHKEMKHPVTATTIVPEPGALLVRPTAMLATEADAGVDGERDWKADYPAVFGLLGKHHALVRASKALEAAGEDELAAKMLEKAGDSPLVKELAALLAELLPEIEL